MTPRILFIDHAGVLGGAELYLLDIARHYRATSSVVLFEDGPFRERLQACGVDVEVLPASKRLLTVQKTTRSRRALRTLPDVLRLVAALWRRARAHDIVFVNSQKALIAGALAGRLAGRPVLWNLHDVLTADHFSAFNRRLAATWGNLFATRILVNSEATRAAFVACGGRRRKTHLVYNGLDPDRFGCLSENATLELRRELGLPEDRSIIGVFSRLAPWKGQHVLLEALAEVPRAHVLLVGEALFAGDAPYAERLHRQAASLGLANRVHFLGFRDDVPRLMNAVDVIAHTSTAPEPFGRVIVEGMLVGKPVVATRAGGALEIIDHGETGLLVSPDDAPRLADALCTLLQHPDTADRLAARGREMALNRFTTAAMLDRIEAHIAALHPALFTH